MSSQRSPAVPRRGQSAVVRLAWVTDDRDALMMEHRSLLEAAVVRRHKVLAIAPDLTPQHRLTLLARGIETAPLPVSRGLLRALSERTARRRLSLALQEWRASAMILNTATATDFAVLAAIDAKVPAIHASLPALEPDARPEAIMKTWGAAIEASTAVFVSAAYDARLIAAVLGVRAPPLIVLPAVTTDLAVMTPQPLPPFNDGLVFLGLKGSPRSGRGTTVVKPMFAAAAHALEGRVLRARFVLAERNGPEPMKPTQMQPSGALERRVIDLDDFAALQAAIAAAHVVVVDQLDAPHRLLLGAALAVGRPVLALDAALTRVVIDAGADGWHVPPSDETALAEAMAAILRRPDLLAGMARAAGHKAARRLGQDQAAARFFEALAIDDLRVAVA